MPPNSILIDASYLYALFDESDLKHPQASAFTKLSANPAVIPDVVLVEVAYLANRAGGVPAKLSFLDFVANFPGVLQPITHDDLKRVREIMDTYANARLDFVDCCIMALSERLNITQVCTFDRRDFSIFRPQHCDYLDLLP